MLDFIGVGDLHGDGKIKRYIPDLNFVIFEEVERVVNYAKRNGVKLIVFYGDICETPDMSKEFEILLLKFIMTHTEFKLFFLLGNHDVENSETHSMQMFVEMCNYGMLPHVRIIEQPTTLFKKSGTPLRLLPWPSLDTRPDCLNVIHEEVRGARWDGGKVVSSRKRVKDVCVAGHLHTSQRIDDVHFSGTLYQTSFGEKPKKFFHHVTWADENAEKIIRKIPHTPKYRLENLVVTSPKDLKLISKDPNILYKVFIQSEVAFDADTFDGMDNVVKHNSFKTKTELQALIQEEIRLDEEFELSSVLSLENNLMDWLSQAKIKEGMRERVINKFKTLSAQVVNVKR